MLFFRRISLSIFLFLVLTPGMSHGEMVLDVFDFPTVEMAQEAWTPSAQSPEVELFEGISGEEQRGVRFPCSFETKDDRCFWDYSFTADLSADDLFTLRVFVEDATPISSLTLYFKSPGGWFPQTVSISQNGWQTLRFPRAGFHESSTPAGWEQITGIRFSVWKGASVNTAITATELRLYTPSIKIIQGSRTSSPTTAETTARLIADCLDAYSIEYGMVTDDEVEAKGLGGVELVILPYNSNQPEQEIQYLENFVSDGGKLIAFYLLEPSLAGLLGLELQGIQSQDTGAMQFFSGIVDCLPERAEQDSWNVHVAVPSATDVQVLAYWEDDAGAVLDHPAWLISPRGAFMTHILRNDNIEMKQRLMLSLAAHFVPAIKQEAQTAAIENIMPVGQYDAFDEAVNNILSEASLTPSLSQVQQEIDQSVNDRVQAVNSATSDLFCETIDLAASSRLHLQEAYYLAQRPQLPEFRALWESSGTGVYPGDWAASAALLRSCGFNAVIPIMFTAGLAHFDSSYLPPSSTYETYGDQVAQFVTACNNHGIEAHPRKQTWILLWTEQSFIDQMRAQGRTQVDVEGNPGDWLCPSDPRNYQLEFDSIMELVTNYDIDGIHYDFIRYPGQTWCYCDGCRERFTNDTGNEVTTWPEDCYSGVLKEEYREWRREQITRLVRSVHGAVKAAKPDVQISAAVFSSYPTCRDSVGQDWVHWLEQGYLDFACPMNYTNSLGNFTNLVAGQQEYVADVKPMYPGIGVNSTRAKITPDQVIAQIRLTRELDTGGFVLFNFVPSVAENVLPILGKGLTKPVDETPGWQLR